MNDNASRPHSFIRWAGAKKKYLDQLSPYFPAEIETYYEPFLGSGSVFFYLQPERAVLGDVIAPLIGTYSAVRDHPREVYDKITEWPVDRETYYQVRDNISNDAVQSAAQFIYLNKTCWNGLYRVNRSGKFNVPYGLPKSSNVASLDNLRRCASSLSHDLRIKISDFEDTINDAGAGDFVFLDPPYITTRTTSAFIEYNEKLFTWQDQLRLSSVVKELNSRGVQFVMTNADHMSIRELFSDYFISNFERMSTIAPRKSQRRLVSELIITNTRAQFDA